MAGKTRGKTSSAVIISVTPWWIVLLEGIFALIFGIFLMAEPSISSVFLVTVLGSYLLIRGTFAIVQIFTSGLGAQWGWLLVNGIAGITAGMLVLQHPLYAATITGGVLVSCVAAIAFTMGIVGLILALGSGDWASGIFAALSIIVSLLLLVNLFAATVTLPYLLTVFMVVTGMSTIGLSFHLLRTRRRGRYPRLLASLPSAEASRSSEL